MIIGAGIGVGFSGIKLKSNAKALYNLLGKDGNFEIDSGAPVGVGKGWSQAVGKTYTLETVGAKYGTKAQRLPLGGSLLKKLPSLEVGKYYVMLADSSTDGLASAELSVQSPMGTYIARTGAIVQNRTIYAKFSPSSTLTAASIYLDNKGAGGTTWVQFDGVRLYEITASEYGKIDVDPEYTGENLAKKFPYEDTTLKGLYTVKGQILVTSSNPNGSVKINTAEVDNEYLPAFSLIDFRFPFYQQTYGSGQIVASPNGYLNFGTGFSGSSPSSGFSHNSTKGIYVGANDYIVTWAGEKVLVPQKSWLFTYEGKGRGTNVIHRWEITLFHDGVIQLVVSYNWDNNNNETKFSSIHNGDGINFFDYTPTVDQSYVFIPSADKMSYTMHVGAQYFPT